MDQEGPGNEQYRPLKDEGLIHHHPHPSHLTSGGASSGRKVRFKSSSQSRKLLTAAFPRLILQTNHKKETRDIDRCPCYFLTENPSV